jgi:ABC-2 type transport system permease protein
VIGVTLLSIVWSLVLASIRGQMQYKTNFLIGISFGLVFQTVSFVFLWIVVGQFDAIGGWSLSELTLLYGLRLAAHGLWQVFFSNLFSIDFQIREGLYDRMLLRPMPVMVQVMFGSFRISIIGDLLGGLLLLIIGLSLVPIDWTPAKALFLVGAIVGGALIDGAFQLGPAALAFRFLDSWPLRVLFDGLFTRFGGYPTPIFDRPARTLFTWLIPIAFVAWAPATIVLDRTSELPFPAWIAWCSPFIGVATMAIAFRLFVSESKHYQSAGS